MGDVIEFVRLKIEHRPNVKEDPVPVEPLVRSAPRLKQSHARYRFGEHALQVRKLHNASRFIAHRSQVTHFRNREQTLILGVFVRHRM